MVYRSGFLDESKALLLTDLYRRDLLKDPENQVEAGLPGTGPRIMLQPLSGVKSGGTMAVHIPDTAPGNHCHQKSDVAALAATILSGKQPTLFTRLDNCL